MSPPIYSLDDHFSLWYPELLFIYSCLFTAFKCLLPLIYKKEFPMFSSSSHQTFWSFKLCDLHFYTSSTFINLIKFNFHLHFSTRTILTKITNNLFATKENRLFSGLLLLVFLKIITSWSNLPFLKCSFLEYHEIPLFISSRKFVLVSQTILGLLLNASERGFNMEVLAEFLKGYQSEMPSQDGNF